MVEFDPTELRGSWPPVERTDDATMTRLARLVRAELDEGRAASAAVDEVLRPIQDSRPPVRQADPTALLEPLRSLLKGNPGVPVLRSLAAHAAVSEGGRESGEMEAATHDPLVARPTAFGDVQALADGFKANRTVLVVLQDVDRDLARRILDFCSGLVYSLGGRMERVTERIYQLTPAIEVLRNESRGTTAAPPQRSIVDVQATA